MGLWDSIKDFGGGHFEGEMSSSGSGARIRAGVKGIPIIGDVNIVDTTVPGFARGGVIPEPRTGPARGRADARERTASARSARSAGQSHIAALHRRGGSPAAAPPAGRGRDGLAALYAQKGGPAESRRRQGGASAPSKAHRHTGGSSFTPGGARPVSPIVAALGVRGGLIPAARRGIDEIAPGVKCPSCAAGITTPVR